MPVPKPRKGEPKDKFISRCMGDETMVKEYDQKQRAAICYTQWREKDKKTEEAEAMLKQAIKELLDKYCK